MKRDVLYENCISFIETCLKTDFEITDSKNNLQGYVFPVNPTRLLQKKDLKELIVPSGQKMSTQIDLCSPLRVIVLSYSLKNELVKTNKMDFKRFDIELITHPEYQKITGKFRRYKKTGKHLPLLKVNIAW